jgi:hypothetical protein
MPESASDLYDLGTPHSTGATPHLRLVQPQNSQPATEEFSNANERLTWQVLVGLAASAVFDAFERHGDAEIATAQRVTACVRRILRAVSDAPVEPGESHPSEQLLNEAPWPLVAKKLADAYREHAQVRRSLLLLVGRVGASRYSSVPELRDLVAAGLSEQDVFVREAAVRATETLGPEARELLRGHREENPWLAEYVAQVLS